MRTVSQANRAQFLQHEIGQYIGIISGCLIPRQPYKDDIPDLQEKLGASPTPQTPIKITHPMFQKGYQEGRQRYFQERYILTDDVLLLCFEYAFDPSTYENEDTEEREDALYYEIGQLIGEMCGCVLPRQLHEKRQQKRQKSFLMKISPNWRAFEKHFARAFPPPYMQNEFDFLNEEDEN